MSVTAISLANRVIALIMTVDTFTTSSNVSRSWFMLRSSVNSLSTGPVTSFVTNVACSGTVELISATELPTVSAKVSLVMLKKVLLMLVASSVFSVNVKKSLSQKFIRQTSNAEHSNVLQLKVKTVPLDPTGVLCRLAVSARNESTSMTSLNVSSR